MRNLLYTSLFVIFSLPSYAQSILKTLSINGVERQYKLYVPASYDGSSKVPLVFCFHGLGDNMDNFEGIGMTYVQRIFWL
jgi:polyhydroxybutyrate depolymerase